MFCCPIRSALYGGCNRVKERRRFEGIVGMSIGIRQVRGWRLKLLPTLVWGRIWVFFLKREYKDKYYRILLIVIIPQVIRNKVESYFKPFFLSHMIAHSLLPNNAFLPGQQNIPPLSLESFISFNPLVTPIQYLVLVFLSSFILLQKLGKVL